MVIVDKSGRLRFRHLGGFDRRVVEAFIDRLLDEPTSVEELTELTLYSPVYEMVSQSLPVEFTLTTY